MKKLDQHFNTVILIHQRCLQINFKSISLIYLIHCSLSYNETETKESN